MDLMNKKNILLPLLLLTAFTCFSQAVPDDITIALEKGNAKALAAYFHSNVEVTILDEVHVASKNQATRIIQDFFKKHPPVSFRINYEDQKKNAKYGFGTLTTKKGNFRVNLYFMEGRKEKIIYSLSIEKI
ncbi:MAG: DUF4783 domain-containing protein [Bacteroidales bacterium]|nr:DUF4783 domain-containing protein [Bacteroidales bacterium]